MRPDRSVDFCLALLTVCLALLSSSGAQDAPNRSFRGTVTPYTYLFDTGASSSAPLPPSSLATRPGWTIVPEENVTHKFRGDIVFLNDKIAVVLRRSSIGPEVYSRTSSGLKRRTVLISRPINGSKKVSFSSVRIIENNPTAVMLDAAFKTKKGDEVSVRYRLTTGQACLELTPGDGMGKLVLHARIRYAVAPDFFGDDMVFGAKGFEDARVGLPTENFFLNLMEGCDAIVMCVWESSKQEADIILSEDARGRLIGGCEIQCIKGQSIWIAFMGGSDIWYERAVMPGDEGKEISLDWKPPFPAKWRASFVGEGGIADSLNFRSEGEREREEKSFSCYFRSNRAFMRLRNRIVSEGSAAHRGSLPSRVVVYPIDRSRATPLTVFCPTDVMRNTLGVGPCQYILDMEGFGSDAVTPDYVMDWIEKQFKRKRAKRFSGGIKERLEQMVGQIEQAQSRIKRYSDFARRTRDLCVEEERKNPNISDAVQKLRGIVEGMERVIAAQGEAMETPEIASQLAKEVVALIGKKNALVGCQKLGVQIRAIGDAQNRTLSKCRMAVRRLKQQCLATVREQPAAPELARKIQKRAGQMLEKK